MADVLPPPEQVVVVEVLVFEPCREEIANQLKPRDGLVCFMLCPVRITCEAKHHLHRGNSKVETHSASVSSNVNAFHDHGCCMVRKVKTSAIFVRDPRNISTVCALLMSGQPSASMSKELRRPRDLLDMKVKDPLTSAMKANQY